MQMCLTFGGRTSVFNLIYYYVDKVDRAEAAALRDYKLELVRVLSEHEHWLPLSLPVAFAANGGLLKAVKGRPHFFCIGPSCIGAAELIGKLTRFRTAPLCRSLVRLLAGCCYYY